MSRLKTIYEKEIVSKLMGKLSLKINMKYLKLKNYIKYGFRGRWFDGKT